VGLAGFVLVLGLGLVGVGVLVGLVEDGVLFGRIMGFCWCSVGMGGAWGVGEVVAEHDVDFGAGDAAAVDFFDLESGAEVEGCGGVVEDLGVDSGVDEGAEEHVAADAGEAVEIGDTHGVIVSWSGLGWVGLTC
jgi:hypothetical protein